MNKIYLYLVLAFCIISCGPEQINDIVPQISYIGMSKNVMNQGSLNNDTTFIFLTFSDGDGDIGGQNTENIIVIDKRNDERYGSYSLPSLPQSGKGVNGEVTIRLFTTCCIFPEDIQPCETPPQFPNNELVLEIFFRDEAGNESNHVTTDPITLLCN